MFMGPITVCITTFIKKKCVFSYLNKCIYRNRTKNAFMNDNKF